ncbi:MAG TPA: DUF6152 family protein [Steroidobacteraceae bacterium]|nr:DUF6152 family protein [Steroidobacteraceae bacterium]
MPSCAAARQTPLCLHVPTFRGGHNVDSHQRRRKYPACKLRPLSTNGVRGLITGVAALLIITPCAAHHSYAMWDKQRTVTLHGEVKEFQWTNPHCFIQVLVPGHSPATEWSIELGSPGEEYRQGHRPGMFKPGDKVTLVINPARDGTSTGSFVSAVGSNGESITHAFPGRSK